MSAWIQGHRVLLGWLGVLSVLTFLGTLVIVPWLVVRIPSDYFTHRKRHRQGRHPIVRVMLLMVKNVTGGVFLLAGTLMLVLPGQGLLTIFVGLMLLDFPGKYRFERRAVGYGPILRSINWLRQRAGRNPLLIKWLMLLECLFGDKEFKDGEGKVIHTGQVNKSLAPKVVIARANGEVVTEGVMPFGWGGTCGYTWRVPDDLGLSGNQEELTVKVTYETQKLYGTVTAERKINIRK